MKKRISQFPIKSLLLGMALLISACSQEGNRADTATTTEAETDTTMMRDDPMQQGAMQGGRMGGQMGGMMGHMQQHRQDMQEMRPKMTGDPDYDFALMMTRHHQGGIRMSEQEIANGTDSQLKDIANRTITRNREDIQQLENFTKSHTPATGDTASTMRMMQPMRKMMGGMGQGRMGMGMDMDTTNMDRFYASMMIRHHQMGNEMSREFLKQGKTPEMKQMAQEIVNEQEKEIKELEAWQSKNKQ
ncbi:DUF305 domain-containing protein [uncultured Pontibacter sp.]|uniref:DUF305 domain-containing protein n=1 Tax=uncultured Pontibacter sp. TaxID=453356 RepID=UPI002618F9AB|nr:DUF305 domain-containing protein [uncultured Pontibacter sp.]